MTWSFWLVLAFLIPSLIQASSSGKKKQKNNEDESEEDKFNDYEIYEAMESMRKLSPQSETFYDLFGVTSSATTDQIGRSFRKMSVKYHPDKAPGPEAAQMFNLLQYSSTLLRDPKRRARYEWLLHEAPAWHRESVYMAKKISRSAKITLNQAGIFFFLFLLGGQFALDWIWFGIQYGRIIASRRGLKAMERRRLSGLGRSWNLVMPSSWLRTTPTWKWSSSLIPLARPSHPS